jgi:hypothetical protein
MTALNVVSVTVAADSSPTGLVAAEGNVVAVPDGAQWPDAGNNPIVPMVVHGTLNDGSAGPGACTLTLIASDNFTAGVLNWDFIINIRGLATVKVMNVPVNFSSGASQNVWTILAAAGWTP